VPDIANPFFAELVSGADAAARARGLSVLLTTAAEDGACVAGPRIDSPGPAAR
jgi:DNA-binding LacI/PurR family transcriptional regulator